MMASFRLRTDLSSLPRDAYLLNLLTELPQRTPDRDISDPLPFNFPKPHEVSAPV